MSGLLPDSSNPVDYIQHHLHYFSVGEGVWRVHLDTLFIGWILGGIIIYTGWRVGRNLSLEKPSGIQNILEAVLEFVDDLVRSVLGRSHTVIGTLAMTVFLWVLLMNLMDLIPVDLIPWLAGMAGADSFRPVPTADAHTTLGMALLVFLLMIYYNIRVKGAYQYMMMFLTHPFGIWLFPINIVMTLVEELAKPLSLGLRLFGNMFAGELGFMLVALLPFWVQPLPGTIWSLFDLLIAVLQAFIFMVLTVMYLALAHLGGEEQH